MDEIILNATERNAKGRKIRNSGYIPGILYGDGIDEASSVKFEESDLRKILSRYGSHAKVWISHNDKKKFGFIKDVQKHPVTNQLIHVDVQLVSQDLDVKIQIPIIFTGEESLARNDLHLQIHKSMVDVIGKATLMPSALHVDVSQKQQGDTITSKDFYLEKGIKVVNEDEILGTIGLLKAPGAVPQNESVEIPEETEAQPTGSE